MLRFILDEKLLNVNEQKMKEGRVIDIICFYFYREKKLIHLFII